jgi:AcrR family transcriptional regulator
MAEQRPRSGAQQSTTRILDAARLRFAAEGYERATIRAIAVDADIDPSMVMRYFGSKEGLFAAAAAFDLALPDLTTLAPLERGRALAQHYLRLWPPPASGAGLAILLRSAATNAAAAARVREIFHSQVLTMVAAVATDAPAVRAGLISSQLLGLSYCRFIVKIPALTRLDERALVASLGRTLQACLDDPVSG